MPITLGRPASPFGGPLVTDADLADTLTAYAQLAQVDPRLSRSHPAPAAPAVLPIPAAAVTAPTYDGSDELVHPSVVYTDQPWNGYRYWMAMTPYPSSDSAYENPSILCSSDGITWQVPDGLTNPIEPSLGGGATYNSDPFLAFAPDGYLYCFWRAVEADEPKEVIYYRRSSNGTAWADKTAIIENDSTVRRLIAPSLSWDGDQWVLHAVDMTPSPNEVVRMTADTLDGEWSDPETVTGLEVSGRDVWHLDVHLFGGTWHGVLSDTAVDGTTGGSLYWTTSVDGITWTTPTKVLADTAYTFYKPAAWPVPVGESIRWRLWVTPYSGSLARSLSTLLVADDVILRHAEAAAAACAVSGPYTVGDSFTRDDGNSLGDAPSGQTWTASTGTPGISSNQAYATTDANTRAWIDSGLADGVVAIRFAVCPSAAQQWLVFRATDASNYWRVGWLTGTGFLLQKVTAGSVSTVASYPGLPRDDLVVAVTLDGNDITPSVDGNPLGTVTDSHSASATKHGFQTNDDECRFDDFYVRELVNGG